MVQIQLSVIFLLAAAAIAPIVALPLPNPPPSPSSSNKRPLDDTQAQDRMNRDSDHPGVTSDHDIASEHPGIASTRAFKADPKQVEKDLAKYIPNIEQEKADMARAEDEDRQVEALHNWERQKAVLYEHIEAVRKGRDPQVASSAHKVGPHSTEAVRDPNPQSHEQELNKVLANTPVVQRKQPKKSGKPRNANRWYPTRSPHPKASGSEKNDTHKDGHKENK